MSLNIQTDTRSISISQPDKVLFPEDGITKGDLAEYYARVGETMLPHLKDRPLTLQRFPNGINKPGFYQKEAPESYPGWMTRVSVPVKGTGTHQHQLICDNVATLVYLVDQACITPHIWLSRADRLNYPDKLIFDLDPPGVGLPQDFAPVRFAARALRRLLEEIGLVPFVMTTGSRGLHVVVPLERGPDFDASRAFAQAVAEHLAGRYPSQLTTAIKKSERHGRLFIDYLRNAYAQNSVAPYAARPRRGAPVATPLHWDELEDEQLHSTSYRLDNLLRRLERQPDPWANILASAKPFPQIQSLSWPEQPHKH